MPHRWTTENEVRYMMKFNRFLLLLILIGIFSYFLMPAVAHDAITEEDFLQGGDIQQAIETNHYN